MREKTNCPNCGAPISGIKCEYCGTQFFDLADFELYKEGFLRMRVNGNVLLCKVVPRSIGIDYSYAQAPELSISFVIKRMCDDVYFIEKELQGERTKNGIRSED